MVETAEGFHARRDAVALGTVTRRRGSVLDLGGAFRGLFETPGYMLALG